MGSAKTLLVLEDNSDSNPWLDSSTIICLVLNHIPWAIVRRPEQGASKKGRLLVAGNKATKQQIQALDDPLILTLQETGHKGLPCIIWFIDGVTKDR